MNLRPGAILLGADDLDGAQLLDIFAGPRSAQTTLANLLQFLRDGESLVNTAISTAGAGTLTAAALLGGVITRTGPVAAYTDTTATAAQINTAQGADTPAGSASLVYIKNTVPFAETIAAGSGVTLTPTTPIIPPNSVGTFLLTRTSATAYTLVLIDAVPLTSGPLLASTTLATNGAGTITAAGIAGGITTRTTVAANFTDTTDTADNIIAALPNANIGQSFVWRYVNSSTATATIVGGTGVNAAGAVGAVPPNTVGTFLVTYSAASTITIAAGGRSAPTSVSGTFAANGATPVAVSNVNVTANSSIVITLKTVGGTVSPSVPYIATITAGTGFTVTGTASDTSTYNYLILN